MYGSVHECVVPMCSAVHLYLYLVIKVVIPFFPCDSITRFIFSFFLALASTSWLFFFLHAEREESSNQAASFAPLLVHILHFTVSHSLPSLLLILPTLLLLAQSRRVHDGAIRDATSRQRTPTTTSSRGLPTFLLSYPYIRRENCSTSSRCFFRNPCSYS